MLDIVIYSYIATNICVLWSAFSLNRTFKKVWHIQELLIKDNQHQIDRLDIRVGFLEARHQFKCDCMDQEIDIPPKRRPGRPKKEIQHKTEA